MQMVITLLLLLSVRGIKIPSDDILLNYKQPENTYADYAKRSIDEYQSADAPGFEPITLLEGTSWSYGTLYLAFYKDGQGLLLQINTSQEVMIDSANERYSVQSPGFGDQYTFANGTYLVLPTANGTMCTFTNRTLIGNQTATYAGQLEAYKRSRRVDELGENGNKHAYLGQVYDIGACGQPIGNFQVVRALSGAQDRNWFVQQVPGTPGPNGTCLPSFASELIGSVTSDFAFGHLPGANKVRNFFQLPSSCFEQNLPDPCEISCYACWTYPCS